MSRSLSNIVKNLSEGIHKIKCKHGQDDKKCETFGVEYKYCDFFLEYTNFKDDLIGYKRLCCNKKYQHKFDENLKEQFFNTCKFSNHDNNCFIAGNILMNIWMIGKNYYLKKEIFIVT